MTVKQTLNVIFAISFLQLFSCTGMKSADSLEAMRAIKAFHQHQGDPDQGDDGNHKKEDKNNHHSQHETEEQGHDHDDDDPHNNNNQQRDLSIGEMEGWYDKVNEYLIDQLEDEDLRQLVIWQAQKKVWARAVLTENNQMLFLSCEAHAGHIDCQQVEKNEAPNIPIFVNKEDE